MTRLIKANRPVLLALSLGLSLGFSEFARGQERSKDLKAEEVLDRPAKATTPSAQPSPRRTYRASRPFTNARPPNMEYAQVGVTVWRLLKEDGSDPKEKCEEAQSIKPISATNPLEIGSMVRIGIEPLTRDGFVYVINREQFPNGSYGPARLIFPTLRTRGGNNWLRKNELLLIPKPSCFVIGPSKTGKKHIAEFLTVLVSPTPLPIPNALEEKPIIISDALFKQWERQWSKPINVLEMNTGGTTPSGPQPPVERPKGFDDVQDAQRLTVEDTYPLTAYRALIRRNGTLLVTVPLRFKTVP